MKQKTLILIICISLVVIPQAAFANSSWYWISDSRPWDILPCVALATIIIEVIAIWQIPKSRQFIKTTAMVIIANLLSFLLPYGILAVGNSWYGTFQDILNSGPHYIVNMMFLIMTLAVELPLVYNWLKSHVKDKRVLLWTIIGSNAVTTILVAIVERIIAEGAWA